jgi:glycosyltransferase involved in cell wall biosynthesis
VRVVHVTTVHPAGDNRITRKECWSLVDAGYDVWLLAPGTAPPEVPVRHVPLPHEESRRLHRFTIGAARAFAAARRLGADIYHVHDPELIPMALLLRLVTGSIVIYDAHEDFPAQVRDKTWVPRPIRRLAVLFARSLEVVAARGLSCVIAAEPSIRGNFRSGRLTTVQNYPRLEDFEFVPPERRPGGRFVYVGGLTAERGIRELVDAMALLPPSSRLVLAGSFYPSDFLPSLEGSPGWEHVDYMGLLPASEIGPLLAGCTAGLVTLWPLDNYLASQPTKMYEYMASGLPVICSDFPLWRQVVERHHCGVAVDPRDPKAIAAAMTQLSEDHEARREMAVGGREAVETSYHWDGEATALLTCYAELLRREAPPSA